MELHEIAEELRIMAGQGNLPIEARRRLLDLSAEVGARAIHPEYARLRKALADLGGAIAGAILPKRPGQP